jgi:hypothetical protein
MPNNSPRGPTAGEPSHQASLSEESCDEQSVRQRLLLMEQEIQSQRVYCSNLEQFLVGEVCQDLAGISYLLAAVQLPQKASEDIELYLRRISELLAATLSRCMNFKDVIMPRGVVYESWILARSTRAQLTTADNRTG